MLCEHKREKHEIPWKTTLGMLNLDATFVVQGKHMSETMHVGSVSNSESHFSSGSFSILEAAKNKWLY